MNQSLSPFSGEQIVQVTNPDPFAKPVLRSPVLHTPLWMIATAQLFRLLWRLLRFLIRHPVASLITAVLALTWRLAGWPALIALAAALAASAVTWRLAWPGSWSQLAAVPVRCRFRRWQYQRCWVKVMTVSQLAVYYQGRWLLPQLGPVVVTGYVDQLLVRLVRGQSPGKFANAADNLAHGFGAIACRIRKAPPGAVLVELVRRDVLAAIIPALPIPVHVDFRAVAIGRHEDGSLWLVRLAGSHVLLAGSTGAGKASVLWAIIRGILPALADGTARIFGADPKLMELAYGRALFDRYGRYESDPALIVAMLEDTVADMQRRAGQLAGRSRTHFATTEHPFTVVFVDEVAFLTAYQPDRKLRERALAAIATLTTQGRAVGYSVVGALQDPRKDVLTIRNLFPDRIAMRLDEPEQPDLVLGDGARDRGALADQISTDPTSAPVSPTSGSKATRTRSASAPRGCRMRTSTPCAPSTRPCPPSTWRGVRHERAHDLAVPPVRLVHQLAGSLRGGCSVTRVSRAERLAMPLGATAIRDLTEAAGGCIRPVQLRRTNNTTGEVDYQLLPCRSTLEDVCPPCAKRAQSLRAEQCRDGWHLDHEPDLTAAPPDETQEFWLTARAAAQVRRDKALANGEDTAELDQLLDALDDELAACGIRGNLATRTNDGSRQGTAGQRRSRSTRRRQDAPELPRRKMTDRTTGQVYESPDGTTYRPSMFLTLTCDSYGKVRDDGTPLDPAAYDYQRPHAMPSISRPCSTGSSRTCAATSATTSSTSPPSNRKNAWLRTRTSRSAAPSPGRICGRSSPPPTTRSGGPPPAPCVTATVTTCPSGMSHPATTSTPSRASCSPPGTRPSTTSARKTNPGTSPGSDPSSTPRAC